MFEHGGVRFRIGDAFPADDPAARWMVVCAMALDDLLLVSRWLFPRLEGTTESTPYENAYLGRIAGSHLFEVAKFLEGSAQIQEVQEFIAELDEETCGAYDKVRAVGPRGQTELAKQLGRARNHSFHYAELLPDAEDHEDLKAALEAHADNAGEIRDEGSAIDGFRASFADDVAIEISFPEDEVDLPAFITNVAEHIGAYLKFGFEALPKYVQQLPSDTWEYIDIREP